jgi:hypothetical protein
MERRVAAWAAVLVALAACAALPATTTANKISVNWMPNTNYTVWEQTHGPFYKGDWLGTSCLSLPLPRRRLLLLSRSGPQENVRFFRVLNF